MRNFGARTWGTVHLRQLHGPFLNGMLSRGVEISVKAFMETTHQVRAKKRPTKILKFRGVVPGISGDFAFVFLLIRNDPKKHINKFDLTLLPLGRPLKST